MVLVIPSIVVGVIPTLIGFFIMASICGLFISVILQLAHLVEACDFPVPEEKQETLRINGRYIKWRQQQILQQATRLYRGY